MENNQTKTYTALGLMSGTSLDGVDGVLIDLTPGQAPRLRRAIRR